MKNMANLVECDLSLGLTWVDSSQGGDWKYVTWVWWMLGHDIAWHVGVHEFGLKG